MNKFSKLIIGLCVLAIILCILNINNEIKSDRGMDIYDTKKLSIVEKKSFKESIKTGDAYVYYGDHEKAAKEYKQAEIINPNDKQTLYRLASSQHNAKQYEEAEKTLAKLANLEINSAGYWSFRATNLSYIPTSIENMKKAAIYYEKAAQRYISKDSYMTYELKANIYFNLYKYYRAQRNDSQPASQDELFASKKFFEALAEIKRLSEDRDYYGNIKELYKNLYNEYNEFPHGTPESKLAQELPRLIEYTQDDIENHKRNRPRYNFDRKN